jgi:putative membrane protein
VIETATAEPRQRLHPLSPLLHSAKYMAVLIAAISIQGAAQLGVTGFLGTVVVAMVFATAYAALSWLVTGYHVVGRELRIYNGVLVRRTRAIPLERVQAVDVVRPLLARLAGLAELRLEVVGGTETEAPLAYLTVADAAALRSRLLALAARAGAVVAPPDAAAAPEPPPVPAEQPLHAVVNRDVLISQLLTPQVIFLPFGIAVVVAQYWFDPGAWSFVVLASMVLAIIGVIRQPVRRILSDWNFRLALQQPAGGETGPDLRVRSGLTETRSQTVPLRRVQAVGVTWPLLWRHRHWLRCRLDVAGYGRQEARAGNPDRLLPVGDLATARRLTGVVLPGVDLAELGLTGPPRRARWLAPFRTPILGAALDERVFATRDGRITRRVVVVPYQRLQSVRVTQGPLQRWLDLANVYADTAGSLTAVAYHRELAEARRLAGELTERARLAREAERAARQQAAGRAAEAPADDPATTG